MEKYWIYIIVALIYVIRWFIKKASETPHPATSDFERPRQQARVQTPVSTTSKQKPLTFEELLREITEAKTVQETPKSLPKPIYADYDDDIEPEEKSLEEIPFDYRKKDKIYNLYEEGKKQAFNRPSLEETLKLQDTDTKFGKFKVFEQEEQHNPVDEYVRQFQDPEGFKKAFVMSEILKPKFSNG